MECRDLMNEQISKGFINYHCELNNTKFNTKRKWQGTVARPITAFSYPVSEPGMCNSFHYHCFAALKRFKTCLPCY